MPHDDTFTRLRDPEKPGQISPAANVELEQSLLGSILFANRVYEQFADILRPHHFSVAVHGRIYEATARLIDRGEQANPITLKLLFDQDGALQDIGGSEYLARLAASAVTLINGRFYARQIIELANRRVAIEAGRALVEDALRNDLDRSVSDMLEDFDRHTVEIDGGHESNAPKPIGSGIDAALASVERIYKHGSSLGIQSRLVDLDRKLGGLQPSDLIVVGGRPSMGKTAAVMGIAYAAARDGHSVLIFSLEMPEEQLMARLLGAGAGVSAQDQRRGPISRDQRQLLIEEGERLRPLPLWIDDTGNATVAHIRRRSLRHKRQRGLGLILIDYLQLVRGYGENRVQEVSSVSRDLKALAKELDVPVVAAAQLSRALEIRPDKRPLLSDLRDSGTIEQDADVIIFLFREEYYLERQQPSRQPSESDDAFSEKYDRWTKQLARVHGIAELIIAKNRQGETGIVKVQFDAARTRFRDLAKWEPQ